MAKVGIFIDNANIFNKKGNRTGRLPFLYIIMCYYKVMFCKKEISTPAATAEPITPDTLDDMQ